MTFLLTDIEGSTQAWQAAPGEMTALVSRHYDILESGIAAHHGRRPQEQGEGDSVVAVFTDPRDALAVAVETQLVLREQLPNLPVRMALHYFVTVVVVPPVDLLGALRQELVEAPPADADACPRVAVGRFSLPVLHYDDARLSANVATGRLCALCWIESGVDELLEEHRGCPSTG